MTERLRLDYMATISNLFNHPNFDFPGSNISVPGQAGSHHLAARSLSGGEKRPRFIDMRVRLEF